MSRKLTMDEVKAKIFAIHGDAIVLDESTYVNTKIQAHFYDKDYGYWKAIPNSIMQGQGHKKRGDKRKGQDRKYSVQCVMEKIYLRHRNVISLDISTYFGTHIKATFVDIEHGRWEAMPFSILAGHGHPFRSTKKAQQTNLLKYGAINPQQNKEIALKTARTANKITDLIHWKTEESVPCQGSYEVKIVEYLNSNTIDYIWQPEPFTMPDGKTYRIDCYLINDDKYIEIKGYMRKDAQEKWDWFHKAHPNSELWDRSKLKSMGVKVK